MFDGAHPRCYYHSAGWSSPVARWAHNPKVVGSNPTPATIRFNRLRETGEIEKTPKNSQSRKRTEPRLGPFSFCPPQIANLDAGDPAFTGHSLESFGVDLKQGSRFIAVEQALKIDESRRGRCRFLGRRGHRIDPFYYIRDILQILRICQSTESIAWSATAGRDFVGTGIIDGGNKTAWRRRKGSHCCVDRWI